jgi:hypothetical protein
MICESHERLPEVQVYGKKKVVRWGFRFVDAVGDIPCRWIYNEVAIDAKAGREEMIDAIIREQYSKSAELALINNKIASLADSKLTKYAEEYTTYNAARVAAKALADTVVASK